MARWEPGQQTVEYLIGKNRLESFESRDLSILADALVTRAVRRVDTTAAAALGGGDIDGAYVAAYDGYRMAAESLLARQGLRATGGEGSHMSVEDAVSAQFAAVYGVKALLAKSPPGRDAEGPGQHIREPRVVGTRGVGTDQPGVPDLPRCHQARLLRPLDLPVDGRMRDTSLCRYLREA